MMVFGAGNETPSLYLVAALSPMQLCRRPFQWRAAVSTRFKWLLIRGYVASIVSRRSEISSATPCRMSQMLHCFRDDSAFSP